MGKYIDADKLIAEIERRKEKWLAASRLIKKGKDKAMYAAGKSSAYTEFFSLINSLQQEQPQVADASKMEQPEIDFEQVLYNHFGQVKDFTLGMRIAAYFYELGLNARKEK